MISVLGSLNMDLVAMADRYPDLGETVAGREFRTIPGGKGANQAVAAARAGGRVTMMGAVGTDAFGDQLVQTLVQDGVDVALIQRAPGTSGTAHIVVDRVGQNAIVVIPGANGTVTALRPEDRACIIRSLYLLMQLELPMSVVEEAAAAAQAAGVEVMLTPAPAPVQPLPTGLLRNVSWLIPNQHEAARLTGLSDPLAAGAALLAHVRHVVITMGAEGCLYFAHGRSPLRVSAPKVVPVDTTAAGDTFSGALAVALLEGRRPPEALAWACRAAAISVTRVGASTSMPTRAEIDAG